MQPDRVDSNKMISVADHRWDEQDHYELDKYKDCLLRHDHLERTCKQQLEQLHEQGILDSDQQKWESGESLNLLAMKALEDLGNYEEEIERLYKVKTELNVKDQVERGMRPRWVKDQVERGMRPRWAAYFQQSLQDWQHEFLCIKHPHLRSPKEFDKYSGGVDTNNSFSSIYVPNSVRVEAQGSHTNMEEKHTTVGSVGCAGDESSSALLSIPTFVHQQLLLNNTGGGGGDVPCSNHAPTIKSSTEAYSVPLGDQPTANQSQDKSKHYLSPDKVDNQLEAKHNPIQMMATDSKKFGNTSDSLKKSVVPMSIIGMILASVFLVSRNVFGGTVLFRARPESESPEPGTVHKFNLGDWIQWIRTTRKRWYSGPFKTTSTNKKTCSPRPGKKGFVLHSADAKDNRVRKNISVISRASNGGSSSEGTSSTLTGDNNHHSSNDMPPVILDNAAEVNCTGIFNVLSNLTIGPANFVLVAANTEEMETFMSGSVLLGNYELHDVHFCPDLKDIIIVSGSMLDNDDYEYTCGQGKCTVRDLKNDATVGEGRLVNGSYMMDYLKIPRDRTRATEQPGIVTTVWNSVCSALHRLGLKY